MQREEEPVTKMKPPAPEATPQMRSISALTLDEAEFQHSVTDTLTLRAVAAAACKHVTIGTAVMPGPLFDTATAEPEYAATIRSEFNAIVVEHHLKWSPLCVAEPGPLPDETPSDRLGRYDFYETDRIVDWALQNGLQVKGHVLVWHVTSPTALLQPLEAPALRAVLKRHIFTTMAHFRGRIRDWDVVNESLAPDGSLAENIFYEVLGPSYIADAFRWAHQADPTARLFYNDNKVEAIGSAKSDAFYNLVADLKGKGIPIHGVGLQAHFKAAGTGRSAVPTPRAVKQQIKRLGALGLAVHLSEMDVRVGTLEPPSIRPLAQTQIYHDILAAALSEPATEAIYLWGFTDKHTWIDDFYAEAEDEAPLLWDNHYRRKPAYYAVRQALQSLTPQGRVGGEGVLLESDVDVEGNLWGHGWRPDPAKDGTEEERKAGDNRPDWLQTTNAVDDDEAKKPDWLQDTTPPARNATNKPAPDALFNLREDEAEVDIVEQNHRTMSSMELLHHDGQLDNAGPEESTDGMQSGDGLESGEDDDLPSGDGLESGDEIDQSGDEMTQHMENLRDDIPEIS
uniref:endo-1,4-beta-xylanase n=1 Tax=Amphora coffeiformis TaxID=265554 RepID=A0A7S3KXK5_9STRA|mmetsp:Transcript_14243/g.27240  ORF Transcript_14243/g.27240 Transcript_14243/m.27240 type:complete len:567 (-) Transcript_14243:35-1735(-)|eukprot:scaffold4552_cov161-Amphora_coffeaeformis.AAC.4